MADFRVQQHEALSARALPLKEQVRVWVGEISALSLLRARSGLRCRNLPRPGVIAVPCSCVSRSTTHSSWHALPARLFPSTHAPLRLPPLSTFSLRENAIGYAVACPSFAWFLLRQIRPFVLFSRSRLSFSLSVRYGGGWGSFDRSLFTIYCQPGPVARPSFIDLSLLLSCTTVCIVFALIFERLDRSSTGLLCIST